MYFDRNWEKLCIFCYMIQANLSQHSDYGLQSQIGIFNLSYPTGFVKDAHQCQWLVINKECTSKASERGTNYVAPARSIRLKAYRSFVFLKATAIIPIPLLISDPFTRLSTETTFQNCPLLQISWSLSIFLHHSHSFAFLLVLGVEFLKCSSISGSEYLFAVNLALFTTAMAL